MPNYEKLIATKIQRLERDISILRALEASGVDLSAYAKLTDLADFVDKTNAQTIGGVKTFTSIPVLPASDPVSDEQAVRKKYVDDKIPPVFIPPSCFVYNSVNISVPDSTNTVLTFNSEDWDTDNMHSTSSNTSRLTSKTAGIYLIHANVETAMDSGGSRQLRFRKNGSTYFANTVKGYAPANTTTLELTSAQKLNVNDYVEVVVWHSNGRALNMNATNRGIQFGMTWLRPLP